MITLDVINEGDIRSECFTVSTWILEAALKRLFVSVGGSFMERQASAH